MTKSDTDGTLAASRDRQPILGVAALIVEVLEQSGLPASYWVSALDAAKAVASSYPETDPLSGVVRNFAWQYDMERRGVAVF